MIRSVITSALLLAGTSLVGCAAAPQDDVAQSEDQIIGWLTSPPHFDEENLEGNWVARNPESFVGEAVDLQFAADRTYHVGEACSGDCAKTGDWYLTDHPVPTSIVGVRVNIRNAASGSERSLYVWAHPSGEVRLVDLDTCSFLLFSCKNTWTKTPALTVGDL